MFKTKLKVMSFILAITMVLSVFSIAPITVSAKTIDSKSVSSNSATDDEVESGDYTYTVLDNGTAEITGYTGYEETVDIPSQLDGYTVTSIGESAFSDCSLTSITIPNSVTNIRESAFWDCDSLTSITIPNSVTSIGDYAFKYCYSLSSITIPNSVTCIGNEAFNSCSGLKKINVGSNNKNYCDINGVLFTKDQKQLIQYAIGKEDINYVIPNSVTSIGDLSFHWCTNLESITIPNSVTSIGYSAFDGCDSLISITISNSVTEIGASAFKDTSWFYNQKDGIVYAGKVAYKYKGDMPEDTSIKLLAGTLGIAGGAFWGCENLTSVTIPNSVTNIGDSAFYGCTNLRTVTIPDSVTNIGDSAFYGCTNLRTVTIPDSVTTIEDFALGYYYDYKAHTKTIIEGFTIKGYKGTQAEIYANDNNIPFVSLGEKVITGDVTGDGKLSITDTTLIQKYLANRTTFTADQLKLADVNKDGKVNIDDCTLIQKVLAKRATL